MCDIREKNKPYYGVKTTFKEELEMKIVAKHIVEIAGGLVLGGLMSDVVDKAIEVSKKAVKKAKKGS